MNGKAFTPFPVLETEDLLLRQLAPEDEQEIFALHTNEIVRRYMDTPTPKSIQDVRKYVSRINSGITGDKWIFWGLTLKGQDKLMGTICIWNYSRYKTKAEVGFQLRPEFHGRGFMQQALAAILPYAFEEIQLKEVEAYTHVDNAASIRLLERNGFRKKSEIEEEHSSGSGMFFTGIYSLKNLHT